MIEHITYKVKYGEEPEDLQNELRKSYNRIINKNGFGIGMDLNNNWNWVNNPQNEVNFVSEFGKCNSLKNVTGPPIEQIILASG
jgi:hypothetical protein